MSITIISRLFEKIYRKNGGLHINFVAWRRSETLDFCPLRGVSGVSDPLRAKSDAILLLLPRTKPPAVSAPDGRPG